MINTESNVWRWHIGVLAAFACLYGFTCAPGYLWQDSGLIQYRVLTNDIEGFFGLAVSHPLYYLIAIGLKFVNFGWFPYSINLLSALAGAVTVANVYLFLRLRTGTPLPGLVAAIALGVSHTFWRYACIAETYTLWAALFTTELLLIWIYSQTSKTSILPWLAFVSGLALAVHMLASLSLAAYFILLVVLCCHRRISFSLLLKVVVLWILGALPLLILIVLQTCKSSDIIGAIKSAAFGNQWQASVLNSHISWDITQENLLYIGLNFPTPMILVAGMGMLALIGGRKYRVVNRLLLGLGLLYLAFAFRYTVPDRYAFFIPFYVLMALSIGLGTDWLLKRYNERGLRIGVLVFSMLPLLIYSLLPRVLQRMDIHIPTRGDVPYRDDLSYFLEPWKHQESGAERFAREALDFVGPGAIIFADLTTVAPLLLQQQHGRQRPDVHIVSAAVNSPAAPLFTEDTISDLVHTTPVYVVSRKPGYCPSFILDRYQLARSGVLWQVVKPEAPSG